MWIVNIALRRPYTFIVAALLILFSMPYVLRNMPTDIFPAIEIPVVAEMWEYKGLTAQELSDRIIGLAERELGQAVDGIEHTESLSLAGLGIVKVFFQPGTDVNAAMTQVTMSANSAARQMPVGIQAGRVRRYSAAARADAGSAAAAANQVAAITEDRYQVGLASAIERYTARQNALAAQLEEQQLIGQQWVNTVYLIKALGGAWSVGPRDTPAVVPEPR